MTYGLVAIVKDEAATIERCLASVRPYICAATIVDTGSTDDTIERVRAALKGIQLTLVERPWVDFGTNRSEAFALARGSADWLLALDADMTVEIDSGFAPDLAVDAYMIEMGDEACSYRLPLLLRGDLPWQSRGAVHEYTTLPTGPGQHLATDAIRIVHHGEGRSSPEKSRWHAALLEAAFEREPSNSRTAFYLGQTYWDLRDWGRSIEWYMRRTKMGGFEEERWFAEYRVAVLSPGWSARQLALMEAWNTRPWRLEPVHALVRELNARSRHHAAYALAQLPAAPPPDELFVARWVWDYGMAFERSIAAWWTGRRDEAAALNRELLADPRLPAHLRVAVDRNASFDVLKEAAA